MADNTVAATAPALLGRKVATRAPAVSSQMALLNRAHQQAAVAALGQAALVGIDLATLVDQTVIFIGQTLCVEFASVFKLNADAATAQLIAGFGWPSSMVGHTAITTEPGSMAAHVLESAEPVIASDLQATDEFHVPAFIHEYGVVSGISVVIPGKSGPWGILEAQTSQHRSFDEDDFYFLHSLANVISTAHARKEAELENENLAAFAQQNPNPVVEFADDGTLAYFNDAARAMAALLQKESPTEFLPTETKSIVARCLETGANVLDHQFHVSGRTIAWSFFPISVSRRVHAYAVDMTERLNLEAQLRQSQKMEAIGQLAAGVAHDFNNILTIMQGLVRRLSTNAPRPEQTDALQQLFETSERAAGLTRQLLAFSRRQVIQPRVTDLREIVNNMTRMLQRLIGEDITLKVNHADSPMIIEADGSMIEQIILNLAVNARDAMPRGGELVVCTEAAPQKLPTDAPLIRLKVTDTGCGMTEEVKARMFEPFFTTKESGKGTGLGLATVFGIVKQHAGQIAVESEPGQGTTFTILFPASDKQLEILQTPAAEQEPSRGAGETILLVEDEPLLRELARVVLEQSGYTVLEAGDGDEAFTLWEQHHRQIDALLTDMILPGGVSGREIAMKLRSTNPHLKVIYTTGYSQDLLEASDEKINFLQKPYPPETLMRTVRACLDAA